MRRVAGRRSSSAQFRPTLQRRAPAGTLAYVASGDLAGALQRLLVLAGPGAGAALPRILKEGGAPLITLGNLGRESAIVIAPGADGPVLTLMSRVRDPAKARAAMTALEAPLARLVAAPAGAAFSDISPAGAPARTLSGTASAGLTWALDGSTLIFSTAPSGVTDARSRDGAAVGHRGLPVRRRKHPKPDHLASISRPEPTPALGCGHRHRTGKRAAGHS